MKSIRNILIVLMVIASISIGAGAVIKQDYRTWQEQIASLLKTMDISGSNSSPYFTMEQISNNSVKVIPSDSGGNLDCSQKGYLQVYYFPNGYTKPYSGNYYISCPNPQPITVTGLDINTAYRMSIFAWQGAVMYGGFADFSLTPYTAPTVSPTPQPTVIPIITTPTPAITSAPIITPTPAITSAPIITPTPAITSAPNPSTRETTKPISNTSIFAWFINLIISAIRGITGVAV